MRLSSFISLFSPTNPITTSFFPSKHSSSLYIDPFLPLVFPSFHITAPRRLCPTPLPSSTFVFRSGEHEYHLRGVIIKRVSAFNLLIVESNRVAQGICLSRLHCFRLFFSRIQRYGGATVDEGPSHSN